jgi:hypothetical protein
MKRLRQKPVSRCRVWKLKDAGVNGQFMSRIQEKLAGKKVKGIWNVLKNGLLKVSEKMYRHKKGRMKHKRDLVVK